MASLALGAVGAWIGGVAITGTVMGMSGAAIGWAVGSAIGSMLDQPDMPDTQGPRLGDLTVQSSARGAPIPSLNGTTRLAGNVIWSEGIQEHRNEEDVGGKGGGGGGTHTTYTYTCSFAIGLCKGEIDGIRKMWADSVLIFDASTGASASSVLASGNTQFEVYPGSETQDPSPTIQANEGVSDTPAYRGLAYIVLNDLQLEKFGNRIPNITCEVVKAGTILPVYASEQEMSAATGNLQNAYYFDTSGVYLIDTYLQAANTEMVVKEMFWSPGGAPVETNRFVHSFGLAGIPIYDNPLPQGKSDEPGYFLTGVEDATWYRYPIYVDPDGVQRSFKALNPRGGPAPMKCAKFGNNFWFYRSASFGNQKLRKEDADMAWPDTVTNGVITPSSIFALRATADYFFILAYDDVDGYVVVRYEADKLYPLDFIALSVPESIVNFEAYDSSSIAYVSAVPGRIKIHEDFSSAYSKSFAVPDSDLYVTSTKVNWGLWLFGDESYLAWTSKYGLAGRLYVGHDGMSNATVALSSIVSDLCIDTGMSTSEIDVAELTHGVRGYVRSRPMTARAALEPLLNAYNIVGRESDYKIKFSVLDGLVDKVVDPEHLAAHEYGSDQPDDLTVTRQQEQELPRRVSVAFIDPDDDYQQGLQHAQRIAS